MRDEHDSCSPRPGTSGFTTRDALKAGSEGGGVVTTRSPEVSLELARLRRKKKKNKKRKEEKRKERRWEEGTQGVLATRKPKLLKRKPGTKLLR